MAIGTGRSLETHLIGPSIPASVFLHARWLSDSWDDTFHSCLFIVWCSDRISCTAPVVSGCLEGWGTRDGAPTEVDNGENIGAQQEQWTFQSETYINYTLETVSLSTAFNLLLKLFHQFGSVVLSNNMNLSCFVRKKQKKQTLAEGSHQNKIEITPKKSDFWIIQQENPHDRWTGSVALLGRFLWSSATPADICFYLIFVSHLQLVKICGSNSQVSHAVESESQQWRRRHRFRVRSAGRDGGKGKVKTWSFTCKE